LFEPGRDTDFRAVVAKMTGSVDTDPVGLAGEPTFGSEGAGVNRQGWAH
jgi:hypothetical protein